jgi:histidinol-phosphate aminotransferase
MTAIIDACERSPSYIRAIAPYQPGKPISELASEMGLDEAAIIKLASNENPLGTGAAARRAIEMQLHDIARYPDGSGFELKRALAARHRIDEASIVLGNGSNDVLEMVARAFLAPGTSAVYAQHAFAVYPIETQASGASAIVVPAKDYGHDLDTMVAAIREDTRVLWIANPNNPTGTFITADKMEAGLRRVEPRVIVVLDEAYNEYLPDAVQFDSMRWVRRYPNLVITRTFSKAYGLAGLRVGYAVAHPQVADLMNRVRQPFNVTSIAQAAAVAAMNDTDFVARSRELNRHGLAQLCAGLDRLARSYIPSFGNFLTFHAGAAGNVYQRLLQQGVIVRPIAGYGMPEHLRVTVGLESENERFLQSLQTALHA